LEIAQLTCYNPLASVAGIQCTGPVFRVRLYRT